MITGFLSISSHIGPVSVAHTCCYAPYGDQLWLLDTVPVTLVCLREIGTIDVN